MKILWAVTNQAAVEVGEDNELKNDDGVDVDAEIDKMVDKVDKLLCG